MRGSQLSACARKPLSRCTSQHTLLCSTFLLTSYRSAERADLHHPQGVSSESCSRDNRRIVGSVKTEIAVPPAEPEASHSCAHAYRRNEHNPSAHVWISTGFEGAACRIPLDTIRPRCATFATSGVCSVNRSGVSAVTRESERSDGILFRLPLSPARAQGDPVWRPCLCTVEAVLKPQNPRQCRLRRHARRAGRALHQTAHQRHQRVARRLQGGSTRCGDLP